MAVTYNTNVINSRLQVVATAIDAGGANGKLLIGTAGMGAVLATILLDYPCGTVAAGVLTFSNLPRVDVGADATGTAAAAQITTSAGTVIVSGLTVGTSGTDIIVSQTNFTLGDVVSLTAASITGA